MKTSLHRALPLAVLALSSPAALAQATLSGVVVTATRFAEPADALPLGVSVITADEIRASGATSVNEALMRLLGVPGRQDLFGGGEYNLDLRGFGATADNNQVVVLDGQRLTEADLGGTRLAGIPIDSVERIEVLRGGGSVLYGEGTTGGVIVITTRAGAGTQRTNAASAYAGIGTHKLRDLRANGTLAGGGFSLDASAQRRTSDNHRDRFRSELGTASATGQWSNDWLRIGAGLAEEALDSELPGALTLAQYEADPRQASKPADTGKLRTTRANVFARAELGAWQLAADAGHRRKTLRSMNSGFAYDYDIEADTASLRARHEAKFGGVSNILVAGLDHGDWEREVLGAFGATASQRSRAWYLKDDVTLAGGTRLSAGVRTERFDKDSAGTTLQGRQNAWELGASHPVAPGVVAYARTGRSFRLANADEFNFTTPGLPILPQTSRDHEIGARWQHAAGRVEARLYRSELRNEIGFDPAAVGPFGLGANVNYAPTRRQGLEVDGTHAFTKQFAMRLNVALRSAEFRSGPYAGRDEPLVPRRTAALRGDWTPVAGHRVSGGVNWVSSAQIDFNNTCAVPAHAIADLRYAYQWNKAEFSLGVANLFDRRYFTQAFRCRGGAPDAIYPEPGRTFTAALRVSF